MRVRYRGAARGSKAAPPGRYRGPCRCPQKGGGAGAGGGTLMPPLFLSVLVGAGWSSRGVCERWSVGHRLEVVGRCLPAEADAGHSNSWLSCSSRQAWAAAGNWVLLLEGTSNCSSWKQQQTCIAVHCDLFFPCFHCKWGFLLFFPSFWRTRSNWEKWKKGKSRGGAPSHLLATLLRLLTPRRARCRSVKAQPFPTLRHSLQYRNQS